MNVLVVLVAFLESFCNSRTQPISIPKSFNCLLSPKKLKSRPKVPTSGFLPRGSVNLWNHVYIESGLDQSGSAKGNEPMIQRRVNVSKIIAIHEVSPTYRLER